MIFHAVGYSFILFKTEMYVKIILSEIKESVTCCRVVEMMQLSDLEDTEVKEDTTDFVSYFR